MAKTLRKSSNLFHDVTTLQDDVGHNIRYRSRMGSNLDHVWTIDRRLMSKNHHHSVITYCRCVRFPLKKKKKTWRIHDSNDIVISHRINYVLVENHLSYRRLKLRVDTTLLRHTQRSRYEIRTCILCIST